MSVTLTGCGGGTDGRAPVTGTVTIDGTPLAAGTVTLFKDNGSAGVGTITNGSFTILEAAGSEGIQPGSYKVGVQSWETEPGGVNADGEIVAEGKSRIPVKYNSPETSTLTAEIPDGGTALTFDLKSE